MKYFKQILFFFSRFFLDTGNVSMTRLLTFALVVTALVLVCVSVWFIYQGKPVVELRELIMTLLGFGLGTKLIQNVTEKETKKTEQL